MPEPEVTPSPPVETPAAPPVEVPVETPPEVPWQNRFAELERKLDESKQQNDLLAYRLQQLQQPNRNPFAAELGEDIELPAEIAEIAQRYKPEDRKLIAGLASAIGTKVAQRVGYQMLTQAQQVQTLQDNAALQAEYRVQYQMLTNSPVFSGISDIAKQEMALAKAEVALAKRGQLTATRTTSGSTLPNTTNQRQPVATEEEKFVADFVAKEENRWACKNIAKLDPDSDKGKEFMRQTALDEYKNGLRVYSSSSAVGKAIRAIQNAQVK